MQTIKLNTKIGVFNGIVENDTAKFLGIRYAVAKRFEKPVLVNSYSDYDATKYGASCPQIRTFFPEDTNSFYYKEFRQGLTLNYSEDCLFLNIFRPIEINEKIPVMIFIHGGSYVKGSSQEFPFYPEKYCQKKLHKPIIVVTLNYRLNFLATYHGKNLMLYDMKAAIDWIYANIAEFGGDISRITLSGQSAGAMSVQHLILNPEVKSKIKNAIMISGGGILSGIYAPKNGKICEKYYNTFDKKIKQKNLNIKTSPLKELFEVYNETNKKMKFSSNFCVFPVFDEEILQKKWFKNVRKEKQMNCILTVTKNDLKPRLYLLYCAKRYSKILKKQGFFSKVLKFNHDLPGDNSGVKHSMDLWYFFGCLERHPWRKFTKEDYIISDEIMKNVANFCFRDY